MSYAPYPSEPVRDDYVTEKNSILSPRQFKRSIRLRKKTPARRLSHNGAASSYPIIVHCHLCWDWVWQRPQQFISRLSRRHKILFVETIGPDPELAAPLARFRTAPDHPNITLLRLQFPAWRWDDGEYVDAERRRLVQEFLAGPLAGQFENPIQWFYDPMAVPAFAGHLDEILTVYDCMDELSKFRCAPPEIIQREMELLARADVVFTGGRKLFESKSRFHDNCHFYGCGVDSAHFGKAREPRTKVPADLAALRKPVLGYFGVVDERMDYELIDRLAETNPKWSIAMVGPVLKVEANSLPRRANLHWLGQRPYADLPAICRGLAVCLMPFARNESTEYINPTKALEYMATGRMIISTDVPDVVSNFGKVVKIASTPEQFIAHCQEAVDNPDAEAVERGLKMAAENSWESIVKRLERHVKEALQQRSLERVAA